MDGAELSAGAAWDLFNSSHVESAPEGSFLLVCRVDVAPVPRWDAFADPDLLVDVRLGRSAHDADHWIVGPEDTPTAYVSVPDAHVATGDRLRISVYDRDVTENEYIGAAEAKYSGALPVTASGDHFTAECRAADPARVRTLFRAALADVDQRVERAERSMRVDLRATELGYPGYDIESTQWAVRQCAALGGWEDEDVQARVARVEKLDERWRELRRKALVSAAARVDHTGTEVEIDERRVYATVLSTRCSPQYGCVAQVTLRNGGANAVQLGGSRDAYRRVSPVIAYGEDAQVELRLRRALELKPGATTTVKVFGDCLEGACTEQPLLLRFGADGALVGASAADATQSPGAAPQPATVRRHDRAK